MSFEQLVLEKLRVLPPEKQQEVLNFVESLESQLLRKHPFRNVQGLWSDLETEVTEADIAEIRQEMWKNFPSDDI